MFSRKAFVLAAALVMAAFPLAGTASAATPLPCGSGFSCDEFDPGLASWDQKDTDDRVNGSGCSTMELRSGKNNGMWYAWARATVGSVCGKYDVWIDRSFDGGRSWKLMGYFEIDDYKGSDFGNMVYWPDNAVVRLGTKGHWEPFSASRLTRWH
ncbi:hypothetical protein [Streptomyces sp. NPDC004284]|uniref:hypothetical protein n=1 Tax=Streptomyces sp. NPDC004284 TaxID=3364695 RepID=UPI00369A2070